MNFESFQSHIVLLEKKQRDDLREKYINVFVDTGGQWYQEWIAIKKKCCDGDCYWGYLWDCLKNKEMIHREDINNLRGQLGIVYVFWDIHSCERIYIEDYWKFSKDAMLQLDFDLLLDCTEYLPEDIYIFDQTFKWTLILTHEDIDGVPYCLKCGRI